MTGTAGLLMLMTVTTVTPFAAMLAEREQFDPNTVTPGVIGFLATFGLALIVVLLAFDMVRRVRRTRYRAEIGEQLDAEEAEARAIARAEAEGDTGEPADGRRTDGLSTDGLSTDGLRADEPGSNDHR